MKIPMLFDIDTFLKMKFIRIHILWGQLDSCINIFNIKKPQCYGISRYIFKVVFFRIHKLWGQVNFPFLNFYLRILKLGILLGINTFLKKEFIRILKLLGELDCCINITNIKKPQCYGISRQVF